MQRGEPLREQHHPGVAADADADAVQVLYQGAQLGRSLLVGGFGQLTQVGQGRSFGGVGLALECQGLLPVLDRLQQRRRGGQERLGECPREELPPLAGDGCRAVLGM